jgi:hypothetical protein
VGRRRRSEQAAFDGIGARNGRFWHFKHFPRFARIEFPVTRLHKGLLIRYWHHGYFFGVLAAMTPDRVKFPVFSLLYSG